MTARRSSGQLKSTVLSVLRHAGEPLSVRGVLQRWPADEPVPAFTTVITVLTRLQATGIVTRSDTPEVRFALPKLADAHAADAMVATLLEAADRGSALLSFAEQLDPDDLAVLRRALSEADQ